jgi:NADH dehydrogenase [ubiquinone] 1 alpha subcomplex assembly factor 5
MVAKSPMLLFDSRALRRHRARAANLPDASDFLVMEAAETLADRLDDVRRRFPYALDLGCRDGVMTRAAKGRGGIEYLVSADPAPEFAARAPRPSLVCEAEALPFAPGSFDLVLSNLVLHWTNDLPGALIQLRQALKPGGLLLASLFGGETLTELGSALMEAELEIEGGAGPRVSPFADLRDLGGLLQRAGFQEPVVDGDRIEVTYPDLPALMRDLRAMGESNALIERRRGLTRRATLARAGELYRRNFPAPGGRIRASFQVISLTAWAPA